MSISTIECEKYCIAGLIKYPECTFEIATHITPEDFQQSLNRVIFSEGLSLMRKNGKLDRLLLVQNINNLRITFDKGLSVADYIESLSYFNITYKETLQQFKELKKLSLRINIAKTAQNMILSMEDAAGKNYDEIIQIADNLYHDRINLLELEDTPIDIAASAEDFIEETGNNPPEMVGYNGPLKTINRILDGALRDGSITMVGARTGEGKTNFGMFMNANIALSYNIPVLHLDAGEMTDKELQIRLVSMFSKGKVSPYALEYGKWRKNREQEEIVRSIWPVIKTLKYNYYSIADKTPDQIISIIRRFYFTKVGRGKKFLIHYDYIKPFNLDTHSPEHIEMGHFVQKVKNFITTECNVPFWTSLQLNRFGITQNKAANQIDDSSNTFSLSDRIIQQVSFAFTLRHKVGDEIQMEGGDANMKLIPQKTRFLGEDAAGILNPVQGPDGIYRRNFFNLRKDGFWFFDRGDYRDVVQGTNPVNPPKDDDSYL